MDHAAKNTDRAGWSVNDWAAAAGVGRTLTYDLLNGGKLTSVKVGAKRIITTPPKAFLDSLAKGS